MTPDLLSGAGHNAFLAAALWIQGVLLGRVAASIAVLAVASIGFGMLSGRVSFRRGATVIVGCFILFGAGAIAEGLRGAAAWVPDRKPAPQSVHALTSESGAALH